MAIEQRNDVHMYVDEAGKNQASEGVTIVGGLTQTILAPTTVKRIASSTTGTNATSVKSGAGRAYSISGYNAGAAARYLKIYDKATAPIVGTDVPIWTEYLAGNGKFDTFLYGMPFTNGLAFAFTANVADNDTTGVDVGDIMAFNLSYS